MRRLALGLAAVCLVCGACQQPFPRLNAPPHGPPTDNPSPLQDTFAYMIDESLLEDMTVSDAHFVPHRPMLNALGKDRLTRLAALLDTYGGTLRFDTRLTDDKLIDQRVAAIRDHLTKSGVDTTQETVRRDLPGGRGMDAAQAILIRANEGMYRPQSSSQGAPPPPPGQ